MILTCPRCEMHFNLADNLLGPEGRKVKCTDCGEIWHQMPDEGEWMEQEVGIEEEPIQQEAVEEPMAPPEPESIPESVRPRPKEENAEGDTAEEKKAAEKPPLTRKAMIGSYGAAAAVFLIILGVLVSLHDPLVRAFPAANGFYSLLGYSPVIPGEGLIFDKITVKEEHGAYTIRGKIINLTAEQKEVPMIEAQLRDESGKVLESWIITPPDTIIPKEQTMAFKDEHQSDSDHIHDIFFRFILGQGGVKTASEDAGNNPVPPADDHAVPNGGESHEESPKPGSAPHH